MTTKKVTPKKIPAPTTKALAKLSDAWVLDATGKKLTGTFPHSRYLEGFMAAGRVAVLAEVLQQYPELQVKQGSLKCIITAAAGTTISKTDLDFALRINHTLSTKPSARRA